jgi:hypothetical protein
VKWIPFLSKSLSKPIITSISAKPMFAVEGPRLVNVATLPRSAMLAPTAPRFLEYGGRIFATERATPAFTPWHKECLVLFESHLFPTRSANLALFEKLNESQFTLQFDFRHRHLHHFVFIPSWALPAPLAL